MPAWAWGGDTVEIRIHLRRACALSLLALLLLIVATALAYLSGGVAAQERFEAFWDPAQYTAALREAGVSLRHVLLIDDVFILAYTGALGFAALAFLYESPAAAWTAGLAALALGALDFWENLTMGTNLDMALNGVAIDAGRIAFQASISGAKWNMAAFSLSALTFAIPGDRFFEIVLVWATRLIFPAATALFVTDAFGMRGPASLVILAGMMTGFVLLALVTYGRSRDGLR